jgi:hypothetical protein
MNRQVGQRWAYKSSSYDFVVEISKDSPLTCTVLQSNTSDFVVGYVTTGWNPHEVEGGSWRYLVGQDKPV